MPARTPRKTGDSARTKADEAFQNALHKHLACRDDFQVEQEWMRLSILEHAPRVPPMRIVLEQIQSVAKRNFNVIIQGPPGSPKMPIARVIHEASKAGSNAPRVFNCAGGTTSALKTVALAAQKTNTSLLLSHLDKADTQLQRALLGLVEGNESRRGPRFICTTTRDLAELSEKAEFDGDLLSRLCFDRRIMVPALKGHKWDIVPTIVSRIIHGPNSESIRHITYAATLFLRKYDWPGDLQQLHEMVEWLIAEANESGDTAIRLESMIIWFRHFVPNRSLNDISPDSFNLGNDPDSFDYWWTRLGSKEMAYFFGENFEEPYDDNEHDDGSWKNFEKEAGYCPVLFASEVGKGTLVCDLELHPLYSDRKWLTSGKKPKRRGWKKMVEAAGVRSTCKVTVESADTEILLDVKKITRDLNPWLMTRWSSDGTPRTAKITSHPLRTIGSSPKRRHPPRDWLIHDEVAFGYRNLGFGQMESICEIVSTKWESISARRVKNLYYELRNETRPSSCKEKPDQYFTERYPQFVRPKTGSVVPSSSRFRDESL